MNRKSLAMLHAGILILLAKLEIGPEGKTLVAIPPTYPRFDPDQKSRGYLS